MPQGFDAAAVRQRYSELDDQPLMAIALSSTDAYAEVAIQLAREELGRRGIHDPRFDVPPAAPSRTMPKKTSGDALPPLVKLLCVALPGIVIFLAAGYLIAGKKNAGGEALFLMVVGWFAWFLAFKLLGAG